MDNVQSHIASWVNQHSDELYNWAYYKTSNKELAQDLVQDTFLAAHRSIDKFKGDSKAKTWLFTILNNKIIDHYRSAVHRKMVTESRINADSDDNFDSEGNWNQQAIIQWNEEDHLLDQPEFLNVLENCLEGLPDKHKAVTMAKFFHHKKGSQICQDLDISPSNLWQMVHRAKLQLRKCLDANWNQDE